MTKTNMKKVLMASMTIAMSVFMLSCTSEREEHEQEIRDAYAERNFDEARKLSDKYDGLLEGEINEKEINYLLSSNSRDNANRIMYLYNTFDSNRLPNMSKVLEVAVSQDNDYLVEKLIKGGVKPNINVLKAAISSDNRELIELIMRYNPQIVENNALEAVKTAIITQNKEVFDLIMQKKPELIEDTEVAEYYKRVKGEQAYKKTLQYLQELKRKAFVADIREKMDDLRKATFGTRPPIGTFERSHYYEEDIESYMCEISNYNAECKQLIGQCMDNNCKAMAKEVLLLMQPNIEYTIKEYVTSYEHRYTVKINRNEINEAAKLIR